MNDIQKALLDIWLEFDRVCKKLNIRYMAMGGTLLGAIRHKGFIPWDDDMDFGMLREDYERFLIEAPKEFSSRYFVQEHRTEKNYYFPFIKIRDNETTAIEWNTQKTKINHGLWIDIFPFDGLPSKEESAIVDKQINDYIARITASYRVPGKTLVKKLLKPFKHFLYFLKYPSLEKTYNNMVELISKYPLNHDGYGTFVWYRDRTKFRYPVSIYDEIVDAGFEGYQMPVSKKSIEMLEIAYGNWEQLPPEEDRYVHPTFKVDLHNSYKKYIK